MALPPFSVDPVAIGDIPWPAAYQGPLTLTRCGECSTWMYYPRLMCVNCMSRNLHAEPASGEGVVFTFTCVRRGALPPYDAALPYVIAVVELREGLRVLTQVDAPPESLRIGARVHVVFADTASGDRALPRYALSA